MNLKIMKTKYLMIATVAMLLTACSNDENEVNDGPVEAKVSASFGAKSRAVNTDNTWAANDAIGVMVTKAYRRECCYQWYGYPLQECKIYDKEWR